MANLFGMHHVGESIARFLTNTYPDELKTNFKVTFRQTSTGALALADEADNTAALLLYRVAQSEHHRQLRQVRPLLALDLHYLVTVWSKTVATEHVVLPWIMRQFQLHPVLDKSILRGDAAWKDSDRIEMLPADMSHEQMTRVWDKLRSPYRLSVSYVARTLLMEEDETPEGAPVAATTFSYEEKGTP